MARLILPQKPTQSLWEHFLILSPSITYISKWFLDENLVLSISVFHRLQELYSPDNLPVSENSHDYSQHKSVKQINLKYVASKNNLKCDQVRNRARVTHLGNQLAIRHEWWPYDRLCSQKTIFKFLYKMAWRLKIILWERNIQMPKALSLHLNKYKIFVILITSSAYSIFY